MINSAFQLAKEVDPNAQLLQLDKSSIQAKSDWNKVFSCESEKRNLEVFYLWNKIGHLLPNFITAIRDYLKCVDLAIFKGEESVIYHFQVKGEDFLYLGHLPVKESGKVQNFSDGLKAFYTEVHDGFYFQPSMALGPLPLSKMFCLADMSWEWMEEVDWDQDLDLYKYIVVFSNGGGSYISILKDTSNLLDNEINSYAWWSDEEPDEEEFWPLLDVWMTSSLIED
ncbi:hypothetical protein TDB9533_04756 [Thalassocella blandensis]|nr:hypothetical protein TDB9533_04756 [Thalassocella blandensis]